MSCPTLRRFQGAWLQITEQWGRRSAERAKPSSLHKALWLPADLSIKQLQCLVMLEGGWWYPTQVSLVQWKLIWCVTVCEMKLPWHKIGNHGKRLKSMTYQPLKHRRSIVFLNDLTLSAVKRKHRKPVIERLSNMNMNILFTEVMKWSILTKPVNTVYGSVF